MKFRLSGSNAAAAVFQQPLCLRRSSADLWSDFGSPGGSAEGFSDYLEPAAALLAVHFLPEVIFAGS
jgi:hypothetical protein